MDPATALLLFSTEVVKLINAIVASQPPDVQKRLWEWYVEDMARWRAVLNLDRPGAPK